MKMKASTVRYNSYKKGADSTRWSRPFSARSLLDFFQNIFCNDRILQKNLDAEKVMGTGAKRRFCDKNETESRKDTRSATFYFLTI